MSATFHLMVNGAAAEVAGVAPQTTLLEWLREQRRLTATKEGCAEGDCGACTVIMAERAGDRLKWKPINACIRLLPSLAGKAVFTAESFELDDGALHPVQQALVDAHGSQCGFCTPGFVGSLFGLYKNACRPSRREVDDALSGNLCRCTGYRPILVAAQRMYDLPAPSGWRGPGVAADGTPDLGDEERSLFDALAALADDDVLDYQAQGQRWIAPHTEDALAAACVANPDATIVAGATDAGLWITKQHRDVATFIYTGEVRALALVDCSATHIEIGAAVSLADAFAVLDIDYPELHEAWIRFASVPIRNSGTLGGNVANGSPIGDSMPALIALGATVTLRSGDATREMPLEDFYVAYQKTARRPGEYVARVRVPRRRDSLLLRAYKISKRYDQDISAVFACFALDIDAGRVTQARIGCGGVAPVPSRAPRTERSLAGMPWSEATALNASAALRDEFTPIDDMRASAAYRRTVLGNLLRRLWLETGGASSVPLRIDDVRVIREGHP